MNNAIVLNFKSKYAVGISDEIAVKNCTVLLKPRLKTPSELEEFLMIQLSRATADFLTRKIIQYFSRAARGYVVGRRGGGTGGGTTSKGVRKMSGCSGLRN